MSATAQHGNGAAETKRTRQQAILALVKSRPVRTQEELVDALRRRRLDVTQATVSRDIRELGLLRVPGPGGLRYSVRGGLGDRGTRALRDFVLSVDSVQFMAVAHTPPGTANLVAAAIDEAGWDEVLGTVAGDDTVLVIAGSVPARRRVEQRLLGQVPTEIEP